MPRSTPSLFLRSLAALVVVIPTLASAQTRVAEKPASLASAAAPAPESAPARSARKAPPAPTALESAAKDIEAASAAGGLRHPKSGVLVAAGAAQAVVALMTSPSAEADAQVIDALMRSNQSRGAAENVTRAIPGLLDDPSPSHVRSAQHTLASFMEDSPRWYRDHPPAEVLAIDAILTRLAAVDSNAHAADRARKDAKKAAKPEPPKRETKPAKNEKQNDKPKNEKKNDRPAKVEAKAVAPVSAPTPAPVAAKSAVAPKPEASAPAKRLSPRQEKALREQQEKEAKALREQQEKDAKAQAKAEQNAKKKPDAAKSDSTKKKTSFWRKLVPFA